MPCPWEPPRLVSPVKLPYNCPHEYPFFKKDYEHHPILLLVKIRQWYEVELEKQLAIEETQEEIINSCFVEDNSPKLRTYEDRVAAQAKARERMQRFIAADDAKYIAARLRMDATGMIGLMDYLIKGKTN